MIKSTLNKLIGFFKPGKPEPIDPATVDVYALPDTIDVHTTAALLKHPEVYILDVRELDEYKSSHIPGINHIPMGQIEKKLGKIPKNKVVIVSCRSGNRSGQIVSLLRNKGRKNIHNMKGGLLAWQWAGLDVEK